MMTTQAKARLFRRLHILACIIFLAGIGWSVYTGMKLIGEHGELIGGLIILIGMAAPGLMGAAILVAMIPDNPDQAK